MPTGRDLEAVLALSPNDVWAAGDHSLLHWDGVRWLFNAIDGRATSLWGDSRDDVWAVDEAGILRWDGLSWSRSFTHTEVHQISGSGSADVWATASDALWHWDGVAWRTVGVPSLSTNPSWVWALGPRDVWTFAGSEASHWDGTSWTRNDPGFMLNLASYQEYDDHQGYQEDEYVSADINYVAGTLTEVCVVVRGGDAGCFQDGHWVRRGGRSEWFGESNSTRVTALGVIPPQVWTAHFVSEGDVEVTRRGFWIDASSRDLIGGAFTDRVSGISGMRDSDAWVAFSGRPGWRPAQIPLLHFDGHTLQPPVPTMPGAVSSLWDDGCGHVWASSSEHVGFYRYETVIHRRDESGWFPEAVGGNDDCCGEPTLIGGRTGDEPWAVGTAGYLAHRVDGLWRVLPTGTTAPLDSLWVTSANTVWAGVGDGLGSVLHWDGTQAQITQLPDLPISYGSRTTQLTGSGSPSDVWALVNNWGGGPALLHFDGSTWQRVEMPAGSGLSNIWTDSDDELWALDNANTPTLWHWGSGLWTAALTDSGTLLTSLVGRGRDDLWVTRYDRASPESSALLHFDGASWSTIPSNLPELKVLQVRASGDVWVESEGHLLLMKR